MNKKVLTDAHDRSYWRKKRLKAYKIFGKEFRKELGRESKAKEE